MRGVSLRSKQRELDGLGITSSVTKTLQNAEGRLRRGLIPHYLEET
jgi:hypothetical protein